ncbi:MAG: sugar phosphate nucleotidyltransferase [Chthoniobacterales bacterium]
MTSTSRPLVTQAFVLGAGLGTRLRPLTNDLPKPLVPIFQKPLITFAFDHLIDSGIEKFVVNTHRQPEAFASEFPENNYRGLPITLINEPMLLETGGGIKNVETQLGRELFITYSGDVLTDLPIERLIKQHVDLKNDVTLVLRRTGLGSQIALRENRVVDIGNRHGIAGDYDFANIALWNASIFQRLPPGQKISFIPVLANWISEEGKIGGVVSDDGKWYNIGSRADYLEVHRIISRGDWRPIFVKDTDWPRAVHPSAMVDPTAQIRGCSVVGKEGRVGAEAILEDTILWPGAQIASRSELVCCIVRAQKKVSGAHRNIDI